MAAERYNAYEDLGGQPHSLTPEEERALYSIGLGSKEMRARVGRQIEAEENAKQGAINHAGAAAIHQADVERDRANGVDVDSVEYRLKLMSQERNRTRRS
jgi:hypothetical protein